MVGEHHLPPVEQVFCAGHGLSLCTPKTSMCHHAIGLVGWLKHVRFFFVIMSSQSTSACNTAYRLRLACGGLERFPFMYKSDTTLCGDYTTNTVYITQTVTDTSAACHDRMGVATMLCCKVSVQQHVDCNCCYA